MTDAAEVVYPIDEVAKAEATGELTALAGGDGGNDEPPADDGQVFKYETGMHALAAIQDWMSQMGEFVGDTVILDSWQAKKFVGLFGQTAAMAAELVEDDIRVTPYAEGVPEDEEGPDGGAG